MVNLEERLPQTVILVSDIVDRAVEATSEDDRTLEKSDPATRDRLADALRQIVPSVILVDSPQQLFGYSVDRTLVMTIYGGEKSRNRMALVPAVCEAMGMQFMGADAYARILCQDKHLAKIVARELGLDTPLAVLVRDEADLNLLRALTAPMVVKPNLEGSSIGITQSNLVSSSEQAAALAIKLLSSYEQPVLVEEFAPGAEVSYCISGDSSGVNFFEAVEDIHREEPHFFHSRLYTADLKHNRYHEFTHRRVTNHVSTELQAKLTRLFRLLGKIDYVRVDCRVAEGCSKLIEITPDPYLGEHGGFGEAFTTSGFTFEQGIQLLIANSYRTSSICQLAK
jgi:D-alanine-D-alanine ligase